MSKATKIASASPRAPAAAKTISSMSREELRTAAYSARNELRISNKTLARYIRVIAKMTKLLESV